MESLGFDIVPGTHPIVPVMLGFRFPVVPKGKARIRTQISAAHTQADLTFALEQFSAVKKELGL